MTYTSEKPLVWIIDSPRSPLAGSLYAFEACAVARYFPAGELLPVGDERPDAAFFSAEIEGGPSGEEFARLRQQLFPIPILAAARVRSMTQAVAFFRNGVADYLSLPLDPDEVAERLAAALTIGTVAAASTVSFELEALDGDSTDGVLLTLNDMEACEPDQATEDILAELSPRENTEIKDTEFVEDDEEPEAVDGLPIPTLWEELPCGLLVFDSLGNLVFSNFLGLDLFGHTTLAELQGRLDDHRSDFAALSQNKKPLPDNQWPHTLAVKARAARHGIISLERPDKSRVWLRMDCLPHLSNGVITRMTMTLVNMTGEIPQPLVHGRGKTPGRS